LKKKEVWFWEDGVLDVYHLRLEGNTAEYQKISNSEEVKGIDLDLLLRCVNMVNHVRFTDYSMLLKHFNRRLLR
jgi:hypothetical protein